MNQQSEDSSSELLKIDKFECKYVHTLESGWLCTVHVNAAAFFRGSRYEDEPNWDDGFPCREAESQGVWLFYSDRPYASSPVQRIIVPYQLTFTLEGIPLQLENTMSLAWIANGMNVMSAIKEWENK